MKKPTAKRAKPMDANGELYQQRALEVLPLLVRQARTGEPICYDAIARQVGMPLAWNLNCVLGSIGTSLDLLRQNKGERWARDVPHIQALVVNKASGLPGSGFAGFLSNPERYLSAPRREKQRLMRALWNEISSFRDWERVLDYFNVEPMSAPSLDDLLSEQERRALGGAGESEAHKSFKRFVANHPAAVGVSGRKLVWCEEYPFASSDTVDVLFKTTTKWFAVEVKAKTAPTSDILRGIFQCVKYRALLSATIAVDNVAAEGKVLLALEGSLPNKLRRYANELRIEVFERVREYAS